MYRTEVAVEEKLGRVRLPVRVPYTVSLFESQIRISTIHWQASISPNSGWLGMAIVRYLIGWPYNWGRDIVEFEIFAS